MISHSRSVFAIECLVALKKILFPILLFSFASFLRHSCCCRPCFQIIRHEYNDLRIFTVNKVLKLGNK